MIFDLNLEWMLTYKSEEISFNDIDYREVGSELCFKYQYYLDDLFIKTELLWKGSKAPLTKEEKDTIESGLPPIKREEEVYSIPVGRYKLYQTVPISDERELPRLILPFTSQFPKGILYLRFYKDNQFETVMQLFFPIKKLAD